LAELFEKAGFAGFGHVPWSEKRASKAPFGSEVESGLEARKHNADED
jgi:hypothetical protein